MTPVDGCKPRRQDIALINFAQTKYALKSFDWDYRTFWLAAPAHQGASWSIPASKPWFFGRTSRSGTSCLRPATQSPAKIQLISGLTQSILDSGLRRGCNCKVDACTPDYRTGLWLLWSLWIAGRWMRGCFVGTHQKLHYNLSSEIAGNWTNSLLACYYHPCFLRFGGCLTNGLKTHGSPADCQGQICFGLVLSKIGQPVKACQRLLNGKILNWKTHAFLWNRNLSLSSLD